MGNNSKVPRSPNVLEGRDIQAVANYILSDKCKNVILMLGAGVSTSAGIPDFRSPETGLYANLARLNLPYPEAVFEINFFRRNPEPFYTLAKELYPGKFRPTLTHTFIRLLASHSLLHTCFTQNIDTLERRAGVPPEKIVEAHGSFATQRCINCKTPYDDERMKADVKASLIPKCDVCKGMVKPDIVFFGEDLPSVFVHSIPALQQADLLIVMGTSLTVHPFASLVDMVPKYCPRVLINLDRVGNFHRPDDVVCLGHCDDIVRDLCKKLGWEHELIKEWEATAESLEAAETTAQPAVREESTGKESLKEEVEKITRDMELKLGLDGVEEQITNSQHVGGIDRKESRERDERSQKLNVNDDIVGKLDQPGEVKAKDKDENTEVPPQEKL